MADPYWNYTIRSGDTLESVAARYRVQGGGAALWRLNQYKLRSGNPNLIYPGELIAIPGPPPAAVVVKKPTPAPVRPTPTPVPSPEPSPDIVPESSEGDFPWWLLALGAAALYFL